MTISNPKGTRDFYPKDMWIQNHIFKIWKDTCLQFGYHEYECPSFEHLELYTNKSGDEIISQLYNFTDKGNRQLALRPEMTPSLARLITQKGNSLKYPIRWFSIPRLQRYERAQKGRLREFFQLNMDIIGTDSIYAEVDLIVATIEMFKNFGLSTSHFKINISNRKILSYFIDNFNLSSDKTKAIYSTLDKIHKVPEETFQKLLHDCGLNTQQIQELFVLIHNKNLNNLKQFHNSDKFQVAIKEIETLFFHLEKLGYGNCIQLDLSIVRGLSYYTGIIFEVFDTAKTMRAIAGGGRYDNLLKNTGGPNLSGVGLGVGDVVLTNLLQENNLLKDITAHLDYYLVCVEDELSTEMINFAQDLRKKGLTVSYPLEYKKLKKQMALAEDNYAKKVIFWSQKSHEAQVFEVKNMNTGEQKRTPVEEL